MQLPLDLYLLPFLIVHAEESPSGLQIDGITVPTPVADCDSAQGREYC